MSESEVSKAAKTLSRLGSSKGGLARAERMSPEQRREIAQKAANARWGVPRATHVGEIHLDNTSIPCAVLEDGTRLLTQEGFLKAIGRSGKPAAGRGSSVEKIAPFLALENLKPFIDEELASSTFPVIFQGVTGSKAYGYKAELLPKVCTVYLKARDAGVLLKSQLRFAQACDMLIRGLAEIGIVALVDEATGYQEVRDKLALQAILDKFLRKEFAAWAKCFPEEFYKHIFRLRHWPWKGMKVNRPQVVAHYTKDLIYARLAPGILKELEIRNPRNEKGHRKAPFYWWLTEEVGHPALAQLLFGVLGLMRIADDEGEVAVVWNNFMKMVDRAYPRREDTLQLDLFQNDEFYVLTQGVVAVAK
jgi:hypothetical protein